MPRKLACTSRSASDFEEPGMPTTKIGMRLNTATATMKRFSRSAALYAMPGPRSMWRENES